MEKWTELLSSKMTDAGKESVAILLYALAGGFADATSVLLYRTFTGHVTGNIIFLCLSLARREWSGAGTRLLAIVCFLVCTHLGARLASREHSGVWLFYCQATFLLPLVIMHPHANEVASLLGAAAFCCSLGLQNGVVTSSIGVSVHSTFMTGDLTKLLTRRAAHPGRADRLQPAEDFTEPVLLRVVVAFIAGAIAAGLLSRAFLVYEPFVLLVLLFAAMVVQVPRSPRGC